MAEVCIDEVYKSYGTVDVLHGVSVGISDGSFVVMVGPSGCGKSTLLRMIAGLETISGGQIRIGGTVVNSVPPRERDIAMVFQNYALYPHMTVAENMAFSLRLRKVAQAEKTAKVARAAEILGLTSMLDRYPAQLSGGQRQRVAMGRAIVRDPKVFLFDEPLSNLDAKLRVQMRTEIKTLYQRLGSTSVYVTHDQVEAMTLADKIVIMDRGKVAQAGAPLDLYLRPQSVFVAGFIGSPSMNFIPCEADATGKNARTRSGLVLPLPGQMSATPGTRLLFGIRPEHLDLGPEGLPATVKVVEPTGAETIVIADLDGSEITLNLRRYLQIRPGETLHLTFDPALAHAFDEVSGLALTH